MTFARESGNPETGGRNKYREIFSTLAILIGNQQSVISVIPNLEFCKEDEYLAFLLHTVQELFNPII